jgi:hypothetical protein
MIKGNLIKKSTTLFLILTVLFYLLPNISYSQGPNAPEAASFEPVDATDMVNLVTGDLSYVLPLLNIPSPEGGYPIALSYHAGIAMDQEASWVGLGWSLNPGTINRSVNGFPDDWGKSIMTEFFYDKGQVEDYYNFSIGGTLPNGISLGLGASWGSNRAFGGSVSFGHIGAPGNRLTLHSNGTINLSMGVSIGGGFLGMSSNSGFSIGYGTQSKTGIGFSGMFNSQSGASVGLSLNNEKSQIKNSSLGISFSSNGGGASINGSGITNSTSSVSENDYYITDKTKGFNINLGLFWVGYGHRRIEYSLYKEDKSEISGILYPYVTKKVESNMQKKNHFMDVNEFMVYLGDDLDLIVTGAWDGGIRQMKTNSYTLPNYDNYSVSAQGLSGTISPRFFEEVNLYGKGKNIIVTDDLGAERVYDEDFIIDEKSINDNNYNLGNKLNFYFDNTYNSFLRINKGNLYSPNGLEATSPIDALNYDTFLDNTYSLTTTPDGNIIKTLNRKREGQFIEAFTNEDIIANQNIANGIIEARGINRSNKSIYESKGIGAYRITSLDGKVYHYSLPVYQFETIYKNFGNQNNEDEAFYELKKIKQYATHWLLTAITGPDYIDVNGNGQVDKDDYGYWVEFEYGKWSDGYTWRSPKEGYRLMGGTYSYSWGRKQIYYLDAIKTRTHQALFVKSLRDDNKSSAIREKHQIKYTGGNFDIKSYCDSYISKERKNYVFGPDEDKIYYKSNGDSYDISLIGYYLGNNNLVAKKESMEYVDIPINSSLKLDKILILKNNNSIYDKELGNLTNMISGYSYFSNGYTEVTETWSGQYVPDLYDNNILNSFQIHQHHNVLDKSDISNLDLESKSEKIINFDYNYTLAGNTPTSNATNKGRLTLDKVTFSGKNGKSLIPPYQFKYNNQTILYDKDKVDNWGFNVDYPDAWSLNQIITPTGSEIAISYEPDSYDVEAGYLAPETSNYTYSFASQDFSEKYFSYGENEIIDIKKEKKYLKIFFNTNLIGTDAEPSNNFYVGQYLQFKFSKGVSYHDSGITIPYIVEEIYQNEWIKFRPIDSDVHSNIAFNICGSDGNPTDGTNKCIDGFSFYLLTGTYATNTNPNGKEGGGIRTSKIRVINENREESNTTYSYFNPYSKMISGITSYAPFDRADKEVPFISEIPAPGVTYGYVSVENINNLNEILNKSVYNFETLEPYFLYNFENTDPSEFIYTLGNHLKVHKDQLQGFSYYSTGGSGDELAKFTIYDKTSNVGRLLSVNSYNSKNQIIYRKFNYYKNNFEADGEIGVTQETFRTTKRYNADVVNPDFDVTRYLIGLSSKVNYPSVLESTKVTQSGFSIEKHFDKYDFLTGQLLETRTYASDGTAFKTKSVPAYTKYPQMGSKVDDITNKNMLSQQAASYTYLLDEANNTEKVIGASISTWNNDWTYRDQSGIETTPTNDVEKIWRKHKSFIWDGELDSDGAYVGFDDKTDDGFVWEFIPGLKPAPTKWKQTSEITRYDHYSAPLENMDVNFNYASTKMCDDDSKVLVVSNAKYTEMYYSGAEYISSNPLYFDGEVKSNIQYSTKAHTGIYSVKAGTNQSVFEVNLKIGEHRPGKYKVSVWADNTNYTNTRININGSLKPFNGEQIIAGDWVQLNHYEDLSSGAETIYVTSASGDIYFDDFRLLPIASSMTSYVYNEWDELWYIIGSNGLATMFEYDEAGRLSKTFTEVIDNTSITGGFKLTSEHNYHYKGEVVLVAPVAPTGLALTNATSTSLSFSWNAVAGATGYKIYKNGVYVSSTTTTSGFLSGLASSTSYGVQVLAYNDVGSSALSSSVSMTTSGPPTSTGYIINRTGHTISASTVIIRANGSTVTSISMPSLANGASFSFSTIYSPISSNGTFILQMYNSTVGIGTNNYFNMTSGSTSTNGYFSYQGWGYQATITSTGPQYALTLNIY